MYVDFACRARATPGLVRVYFERLRVMAKKNLKQAADYEGRAGNTKWGLVTCGSRAVCQLTA
jgi:hypothetical protein